jgi:hypothetical protein
MDRKNEKMRYQALQKAVDTFGDDNLKKIVADMEKDIDAIEDKKAVDMGAELDAFQKMNLTERGDLLKKDAAKYYELETLAKK